MPPSCSHLTRQETQNCAMLFFRERSAKAPARALVVAFCLLLPPAPKAQVSVPTVSSGQATATSGSTAYGGIPPAPIPNAAANPSVSGWPRQNGGWGWGTVGTDLGAQSAMASPIGNSFQPAGMSQPHAPNLPTPLALAAPTPPAPVRLTPAGPSAPVLIVPTYSTDTLGNITYSNPFTGGQQTYGTTILGTSSGR